MQNYASKKLIKTFVFTDVPAKYLLLLTHSLVLFLGKVCFCMTTATVSIELCQRHSFLPSVTVL